MSTDAPGPGARRSGRGSSRRGASFNYGVGDGEKGRWNGQAERPGSLEVDHELELGQLLHRQVCGLLTLEDATSVGAAA